MYPVYKAYVFDFDYTLVNSEQGIVMCFEMLLRDEGYPPVPRAKICSTIGKTMFDAMSILTGETDKGRLAHLIRLYKVNYSDYHMTPNTHLYPQTKPALTYLKEHGALCFIVSTKTRHRINQTLEREHMEPLIDLVVGVEDVPEAKPAPCGIQAVQKQFHLQPADILYIGDSLIDADTAVNSGVDFAAVTTGATPAAAFSDRPHIQIMSDLSELCRL